jgi:hypothetical protein
MFSNPDSVPLSVKALLWVGGVATTVVGSILTSQIKIYFDSRNNHRDELVTKILQPLHDLIKSQYIPVMPIVEFDWHSYNSSARAQDNPFESGMQVRFLDPGPEAEEMLPSALFEDARSSHYHKLIADWDRFKKGWTELLTKRQSWVRSIGDDILAFSNLPKYPPADYTGPYLMHLNLAAFITNRLLLFGSASIGQGSQIDGETISDGSTLLAKGSAIQMKNLMELINSRLDSNQPKAKELLKEWDSLLAEKVDLLRQFSLAIAVKSLKGRCDLVKLF